LRLSLSRSLAAHERLQGWSDALGMKSLRGCWFFSRGDPIAFPDSSDALRGGPFGGFFLHIAFPDSSDVLRVGPFCWLVLHTANPIAFPDSSDVLRVGPFCWLLCMPFV